MKAIINFFSPNKWLYSTFLNRTFTFSIWWRLASFSAIAVIFYYAFFWDYRIAAFHLFITIILLAVKIYCFFQQKAGKVKPTSLEKDRVFEKQRPVNKKALVIGAGPCGLVTAKTLKQAGYDVSVLEASAKIGGKFSCIRKDMKLTSSKHLLSFSDFPIRSTATFITAGEYHQYLREYATYFEIDRNINFRCTLSNIIKDKNKRFRVEYKKDNSKASDCFDVVSVCTGLHTVRNSGLGLEGYTGEVTDRVNHAAITGKKSILVVGNGESSWEAIKRCLSDKNIESIYVSLSNGFFPFPNELKKEYFKLPFVIGKNNIADTQTPPLFIYLWSHAWLLKSRLFYFLVDAISLPLYFTFIQPFGIKNGQKILPKKGFPSSIQHFIMKTEVGNESGILGNGIPVSSKIKYIQQPLRFVNGKYLGTGTGKTAPVAIDLVYDGTGFKEPHFGFLDKKPGINVRHIINSHEPNLSFIGFVRPSIGAIPPLAEAQALWWVYMMNVKMSHIPSEYYSMLPLSTKKNRLHGVHFDAYLCQLAEDIGAIPKLGELFKSPKTFISFMFAHGGSHTLRMFGRYQSGTAKQIAFREFLNHSLYSAKGFWFLFLFILMLSGILFVFWMSLILLILSPIVVPFKKQALCLWNIILKKYCHTSLIPSLGRSEL